MKKLLFQKFMLDNFKMFSIIVFSIGSIVWIIQSVNFLDFVTEDGHSFKIYFYYSLLNFPKIIQRILPFVFFISLFYQLIHYEENNQLLIFWIHGIKKIQLINVILMYSVLFTLTQIILSGFISPKSKDMARSYIRNSNLDFFSSIVKPGKFVDVVEDLTIFIEKENKNGFYENIYLKDDSSSGSVSNSDIELGVFRSQIIFAKTAKLISTKETKYFKLFDGRLLKINNKKIDTFEFDYIDFDLLKFNTKTTTFPKIQEVPSKILMKCLIYIYNKELQKFKDTDYLSCNDGAIKRVKQELLQRFYIPIYIPLIALIVCLLILRSKDDKKFKFVKFFLFTVIFIIIIISEISLKYSSYSLLGILFFTLFPIVTFLSVYLFLIKKLHYKF
jgi:lipopolysaccharide export system permease protein